MNIDVWHCSTVCIELFHIPYGGLHLGGLKSALAAGLRKLDEDTELPRELYLHRVRLNIRNPYESFDCGSNQLWNGIIKYLQNSTTHDSIRYWNIYEPDETESYAVFDQNDIPVVSEVLLVSEEDARGLLWDEVDLEHWREHARHYQ